MSGKMIAVMKKEPAPGVSISEVPIPSAKSGELLIKVKAASICGTDLHIYNWDEWAQSYIKPPIIFGHEFAGEVVELGKGVSGFTVGDFVSMESHISCGVCQNCKDRKAHICENLKMIGGDINGGFAEYATVPAICAWKHKKHISPEIASIFEPMGNSVHVVMSEDTRGKSVAIFGCGPTGLFAVGVAKAIGARKVFAIDINANRLELAHQMKADQIINGRDPELIEKIKGCDIVMEMSGSDRALSDGLTALKRGGTLIAFGIPSAPVKVDIANLVIMKEIKIQGIFGRLIFKTWEQMQELIDSGKLDPSPVITHKFKLSNFEEAIGTLKNSNVKCGKVVLFP